MFTLYANTIDMEQNHPIPQEISSYQFRLVGDMTLKQFFQLAGGLLISLLFYSSNLPAFIKWPAILVFAALGAALAFLPYEDRPLGEWLILFFKAAYSPTLYDWRPNPNAKYFADEGSTVPTKGEVVIDQALNKDEPFLKKLEDAEKKLLSTISGHLSGKSQPVPQQPSVKPQAVAPQTKPKNVPPVKTPFPQGKLSEDRINIPKQNFVKVGDTQNGKPKQVVEEQGIIFEKPKVQGVSPVIKGSKLASATEATFSNQASPPQPPSNPNTVAGQTLGVKGEIVEGAILEIKDMGGKPVRAVKTNKLGHFFIVTALPDGKYEVMTEKPGLEFNPIFFEAKGEIIPPIAIKARRKLAVEETASI